MYAALCHAARRVPFADRRTGFRAVSGRLLGAALAALAVAACQPQQSNPEPAAGDPAPAPVEVRGDSLRGAAPAQADSTPARDTPVAGTGGGLRHPSDRQTAAGTGTPEIERLYREAHAIARADGCAASGDCASMPVGSKPCGGPWEYIGYCRLTTDTVRLRTVLAELERRQREYNRANQVGSICDMILQPGMTVRGGRCAFAQ